MHKICFFACLLLAALSFTNAYRGQDIYAEPDCSVVTDHAHLFRDISDPTHYWICPEGHAKANYIQCGSNHAFMDSLQSCVEWEAWKWEEPYTHLE